MSAELSKPKATNGIDSSIKSISFRNDAVSAFLTIEFVDQIHPVFIQALPCLIRLKAANFGAGFEFPV
jgi:hypothetical protein